MALHATWVHGNVIAVESPENFTRIGHYGWGGELHFTPGRGSWLHMALPTPVLVGDVRAQVLRLFLMYKTDDCEIRNVHIWDGPLKVEDFNGLHLEGEHSNGVDDQNMFELSSPHSVAWGLGISFFVQAAIGFDTVIDPIFTISSAGADYTV